MERNEIVEKCYDFLEINGAKSVNKYFASKTVKDCLVFVNDFVGLYCSPDRMNLEIRYFYVPMQEGHRSHNPVVYVIDGVVIRWHGEFNKIKEELITLIQ